VEKKAVSKIASPYEDEASLGMRLVTYEVNADCGDVRLCVSVVGKSQKQARLSDTGITDEQKLEEIVVSNKKKRPVSSSPKRVEHLMVLVLSQNTACARAPNKAGR
jgi:hypothetical protein